MLMKAFETEKVIIPIADLGAAMDSLELSIEYTKPRGVWGKPIAAFEGVRFPLIESITKIESIRSFRYRVLTA